MRVCHVCSAHGADDPRVFHRACTALVDAGYEVHLIAREAPNATGDTHGVVIHPLPAAASRRERLARRRQVAALARSIEPDVCHVHEPELLGAVIAQCPGAAVIWDAHESYVDVLMDREWLPRPLRPIARAAWDFAERRLVRRCAAVVVATDRLAPRYQQMGGRVVVIGNFPSLTDLPVRVASDRRADTCVFTGALALNRGVLEAIRAIGLLRQRGVDVRFELAGDGDAPFLEALRAEAAALGVADLVTYHGILSRAESLKLQAGAGIGLVPHLPYGNNLVAWPIKMLEFMALELPLVYSDLPVHAELIGPARAGIAVDPTEPARIADAIEALVRDPDAAREMGRSGRQAVEQRLNWGAESAKLLALYREIAESRGR